MRRLSPSIILAVGIFFASSAASPQDLWDLKVNLEGVPDTLRIGEPVNVQLNVSSPPEGYILLPDWKETLEKFELLAPPDTSGLSRHGEGQLPFVKLKLTCYETGEQVFQPIPVRWVSIDGTASDSVETDPIIVYVQGLVPDSILAMADTTQQPHHLLQPNRRWKLPVSFAEIFPWILIILGSIGVFLLIRWLVRRRKKKAELVETAIPVRPPHEIALEALDALRDRRLYQTGDIKAYYSELSEIIRRYIEARFDVPALESTSFQLLRVIESHLKDKKLYLILETVLSDADLAKFAKHQPDEETCRKDLGHAYVLVNQTTRQAGLLETEEAA